MSGSDHHNTEISIVEALAKARRDIGMTQKELAEKTGITQADISRLERGNANPSIKTLQRLAAGMGLILTLELQPEQTARTKL